MQFRAQASLAGQIPVKLARFFHGDSGPGCQTGHFEDPHRPSRVLGSREYREKRIFVPIFIPLGPVALVGYTDVNDKVITTLRVFRINVNAGYVIE